MACVECDHLRSELEAIRVTLAGLDLRISGLLDGKDCSVRDSVEVSSRGALETPIGLLKPGVSRPWAAVVQGWPAPGEGSQTVRLRRSKRLGGFSPMPQVEEENVVPTHNSFEVLSSSEAAAEPGQESVLSSEGEITKTAKRGVLIIGSSNVRRVMKPLENIARREGVLSAVHSLCISGGTVPDVIRAVPEAIRKAKCDQLHVLAHVGTNDACRMGSEEIINSFQRLSECVTKSGSHDSVRVTLSICSLVPRTDRGPLVWSRIEGINQRLRRFCQDNGLGFVDLRPGLEVDRAPLDSSGVHYRREAASLVADTLWRRLELGDFLGQD